MNKNNLEIRHRDLAFLLNCAHVHKIRYPGRTKEKLLKQLAPYEQRQVKK